MAISVGKLIFLLTGVNLEENLNAILESIYMLAQQAELAVEVMEEKERIINSDPMIGLLHAICDGDDQALSQFVNKYYLYNRRLSYSEREMVQLQLEKTEVMTIAASTVLIWLNTFSLDYSAYFSLSQDEREKILANIISRQCRRELLGEITNYKKSKPLDKEEYRLIPKGNVLEDAVIKSDSLDFGKLGFDIDKLTKGEILLLYELLAAENEGYELGSKQGDSYRQLWGDDYARKMKMLARLRAKYQPP